MKRAIIYISIFLVLCAALMGMSKMFNKTIMIYYMPDLVNELVSNFDNKDTVYIDGNMLSVYLHISDKEFEIDGREYDGLGEDGQFNKFRGKSFKVERIVTTDSLKITPLAAVNDKMLRLSTLLKINKVISVKTVIFNILTIIIGIFVYNLYESNKKKTLIIRDYSLF